MLKPAVMARIEVVTPKEKAEDIILNLGRLGIAQFIDIEKTKKDKYSKITDEMNRLGRENLIHQLSNRIDNLEKKYDAQFKVVFDAIRQLMAPPPSKPRRRIGFRAQEDT